MKEFKGVFETLQDIYEAFQNGSELGRFALAGVFYEWTNDMWSIVPLQTLTSWDIPIGEWKSTNVPGQPTGMELGIYDIISFKNLIGEVITYAYSTKLYIIKNGVAEIVAGSERTYTENSVTESTASEISKIPLLRYQLNPVETIAELYLAYPNGGEDGWYAMVKDLNVFAYWEVDDNSWKPMAGGSGGSGGDDATYTNAEPTPIDCFGIPKGSTFDKKTMQEMWDALLYPKLNPTLSDPTYTLTANVGQYQEVASSVNITFGNQFSTGYINPLYQLNGSGGYDAIPNYARVGANSYSGVENGVKVIVLGANNFNRTVSWLDGVQPLNSSGANFDSPKAAGSITRGVTIYGVYPVYARMSAVGLTKRQLQAHGSPISDIQLIEGVSGTAMIQVPKIWWSDAEWETVKVYVFSEFSNAYEPTLSPILTTPFPVVVGGVDYMEYRLIAQAGGNKFKIFR